MDLSLNDVERELLVSILQQTLGEVREQVYKSELHEYREEMRQKEALIAGMLARLGAPATLGSQLTPPPGSPGASVGEGTGYRPMTSS